MKRKKTVGVIGGMGPEATVDFMSRVMQHTAAKSDQEHVRLLVDQNPQIPNRQLAVRGDGEDPGSALADSARRLQSAGADFLVMPCNMAHLWQHHIEESIDVPFVSLVDEVASAAASQLDGGGTAGLLTTPGCSQAQLYQDALRNLGVAFIEQTSDELQETMQLVYEIKAGSRSSSIQSGLRSIADRLVESGADILIAACTEFPLVIDATMFAVPFLSSTDVLADRTIELAGHEISQS